MIGSIYGGTEETIEGVGFIPGYTRLFIGNTEYTNITNISYSKIVFKTLLPLSYANYNYTINVAVRNTLIRCSLPSCVFSWSTSVTPYLDAVIPQVIDRPTNLTFTGQNLLSRSDITYMNAHVYINDSVCNVIQMTNSSLICSIVGLEMGSYQVVAFIDG